ncbi:monocarboxylate transporter 12 [Contarinia nasturtii]|uniref:monocarboxylate transporter 12 n=1 Tax=Contarinia nasturtii TaxID=265458 RepID=UPI0012D466E9|nr:monocarboxylate transporter 12 [Contarinia nasturtii]XP_031622833.1 monocarboxylate transporter 12 [Contarinia nasturtii]XP_031622843.1 monocarboxylate transporter 12 [Contarinia nasturtii]XP_031622850.1 monocarboxylate transporter 12 [Contarinia nasturtii]XP_031622859.1 monocarboxylate transporter 12 [Contarinia nasturtii]XP_031622868.1 monocarboxylate transporter 12 [Contarinia nasturtii]XP_031622877.1 monocarboxylate transporter 12 [Contarinia nasturtii]
MSSSSSSLHRNSLVPNGGFGWLVVFGTALTNVFNQSLVSVFGLLYGEHLQNMGQGTVGAALVMNINSVALNFSGLITGPALKRFRPRVVAAIGSLLSGFGLILSSMSNQLWQIIIAYGLVGLGLGFINPSSFIAVNSYFSTKRGRAIGLALAGTGLGQMIMPNVVRILLDEYGFRGAALLMGALAFHGLIGASFFQPIEWHMKRKSGFSEKKMLLHPCRHNANKHTYHEVMTTDAEYDDDDGDSKQILNSDTISIDSGAVLIKQPTWKQRISKAFDLNLMCDLQFVSIAIGLSLAYTASINFSMLFPYFLQEEGGLSRSDCALCMSVLATFDLASRLTLPTITDKLKLSCRVIFLIGAMLLTLTRAILAETTNRTSLIIMSALYGYVRAATVVNQNLTISEYTSQDKLASALSLTMIMKGVFVMTLGQFLGWIRDYTGSYSICLHVQNILLIIVIIIWLPEILYRKFWKMKRRHHPVNI